MPRVVEGALSAAELTVTIIVSRFNDFITSHLLDGAVGALTRHGASEERITVYWAPGAFEIPQLAHKLASSGQAGDVIICLGCVIRGATPHFDYVAGEAAKGVSNAAIASGLPVSFGILTTDTIEQAIERAGTKAGNKGWDAAMSAIEMANLYRQL